MFIIKNQTYRFSVIVPIYNVEDYLAETVDSVIAQTIGFAEHIQLILVNDGSPDNSEAICLQYQAQYPDNILYIKQENAGVSAARNNGLSHATGKYVTFLDSDDKWETDAFARIWRFFEKHQNEIDVLSARMIHFEASDRGHILNKKYKQGDRVVNILNEEDFSSIQMHVTSAFFKNETLQQSDIRFDSRVKYGEDSLFINSYILQKGAYGVMESAIHYYRKRLSQNSAVQTQSTNEQYYSTSPRLHYYGLIERSKQQYGRVIEYIQNVLAYDVGWRFYAPVPDEIRCREPLFSEYEAMLKDVLGYIDDRFIVVNEIHSHFERKTAMFRMKHGKPLTDVIHYDPEEKSIKYKDWIFLNFAKNPHAFRIMALEVKKGKLTVEGLVFRWIFECCPELEKKLYIRLGKRKFRLKLNEYPHEIAKNYYEMRPKCLRFKKVLEFDESMFDKDGKLRVTLLLRFGDDKVVPALGYGRLVANRRSFPHAYRIIEERYCLLCGRKKIILHQPKHLKFAHLSYEGRALLYLLHKGEYAWFLMRLRLLFLRRKLAKQGKIWIVSDRAENAGDNGEVFFKYLTTHTPQGVRPMFAISEKAGCRARLQSEGETVFFEDKMYPYYFLLADKIISSSANEFTINPFGGDARYVRDLFRFKFYYLQHGVACADLSMWLNKYNKDIKMICAAGEREQNAFLTEPYYYGKKQIALTGQARFDELTDHKEKLILILPTWRKAIKQSYDKNTTSVYFDGFKDTEYFKYYNSLINDERLLAAMRAKGYKGLFCMHPIHMKQTVDFQQNDVFTVNEGYVNYNDVFDRAAMMITDYSSVLFDFAYLRKRILYTQFDKEAFFEAQTYDEGYFDYERDGFGPVCTTYDDTVQAIIDAVNEDCAVQDAYRARMDDFFAFSDRDNSRRILEEIKKR